MKKAIFFLLAGFLLLAGGASAENVPCDSDVQALLLSAHPGYTVVACQEQNDAAVAVLADGGNNVLCVAEKQNGAWALTVDNPTALSQGDTVPALRLEADNALSWSYPIETGTRTYAAGKAGGAWGPVSVTESTEPGTGFRYESQLCWADGVLSRISTAYGKDGQLVSRQEPIAIPAEWMHAFVSLTAFDVSRFPSSALDGLYGWPDAGVLRQVAKELTPAYDYQGGLANARGIWLLMKRPDGALVLVGCVYGQTSGFAVTESTPLPEGTQFGDENFIGSLYINQRFDVNISPFADGTWGVGFIYSKNADPGNKNIDMGQNWVGDGSGQFDARIYGDHPWSDVRTVDWNNLPATLTDALMAVDTSSWAVVSNPDSADTLNLRVTADSGAESLGSYYNGTPVKILGLSGDWVQVDVFGTTGWMMTKYLAIGGDMMGILSAAPTFTFLDETAENALYDRPEYGAEMTRLYTRDNFIVAGIVGDGWYHVWFPVEGLAGYVRKELLWPGNG
jgi:hypothetical protein